jgi:hypothetical protein
VKQAARYGPNALCLRFISSNPDSGATFKKEPQELLKSMGKAGNISGKKAVKAFKKAGWKLTGQVMHFNRLHW